MTIGEKIKEYREKEKLSQTKFAGILNIPIMKLKQIESDNLKIYDDNLLEKLDKLGIIKSDEIIAENNAAIMEMLEKVSEKMETDNVNNPKHYQTSGVEIESIDILKATLGDSFIAFCVGNTLKYLIRAEKKNGLEDYKKAKKYIEWTLDESERTNKSIRNLTSEISKTLGIDWLDVISGICEGMDFKKALTLNNIFENIFFGEYSTALKSIDKLLAM